MNFKKITKFLKNFKKQIENSVLKIGSAALTPGWQRACIRYFPAPKQSKTRESRVEK